MLKSSLCAFAVLLTMTYMPIAGGAQRAATQGKDSAKSTAPALAKAKEIYQRDCALCHGDNGNGKTDLASGMNLALDDWTDPKALADKSDSALFAIIRNGKDKMPAEATGRASDAEVKSLIAYMRSFAKAAPVAPASVPAHAAN